MEEGRGDFYKRMAFSRLNVNLSSYYRFTRASSAVFNSSRFGSTFVSQITLYLDNYKSLTDPPVYMTFPISLGGNPTS